MADQVGYERAPFRGMQTVSYLQEQGHCEVALNVDFSDGTIRSRPGYEIVAFADGTVNGLYCHEHKSGRRYILIIRSSPVTHENAGFCRFYLCDETGASLMGGGYQDLVSVGCWPSTGPWSFCEIGDRVFCTNGNSPVMLFDAEKGAALVPVELEQGLLQAAYSYLGHTPVCGVVVNHDGIMLYLRLLAAMNAGVLKELPPRQDAVGPEIVVTPSVMSYTNRHLLWSDFAMPNRITAASYLAVFDGEPLTAAVSLEGDVFIFTSTSVHRVIGLHTGGDDKYEIVKISDTVGCVAQATIQIIGNLIYFLARDGVYTLDFDGTLTRVSEPLSRLFGGRWEPVVTRSCWSYVQQAGWPWQIARQFLDRATAIALPYSGHYLVSLTTTSEIETPNSLTLVYHAPSGAWAMWHADRTSQFLPRAWAHFRTSPDVAYFGNANGDLCRLQPFGRGSTDFNAARTAVSIPLLYVSKRFKDDTLDYKDFGQMLLLVRGSGFARESEPTLYVAGEEDQYMPFSSVDTQASEQAFRGIDMHPAFAKGATFFWGSFKWGTVAQGGDGVPWTPAGQVVIEAQCQVVSRWFRYAIREAVTTGNHTEIFGIRTRFGLVGEDW